MRLEDLRPGIEHFHTESVVLKRDKNNRAIEKKNISRYEVVTPMGPMHKNEWLKSVLAVIYSDRRYSLLFEQIKDYCKKNCAWLKTDEDVTEHAAKCICCGSYAHWDDFEYEDKDEIIIDTDLQSYSGIICDGDLIIED